MKILVTGVTGQLGADTAMCLLGRGHEVLGTGRRDVPAEELAGNPGFTYRSFSLTDPEKIRETFKEAKPDAVIHCASWTLVDDAQRPENLREVTAVNVESTRILAELSKETGAKFVYISTDYVFDGKGDSAHPADTDDFGPLNVYGQTKLKGEQVVAQVLRDFFVVRVSWTYGKYGNNFIKKILGAAKGRDTIKVVNDQFGTPTYTVDVARILADMVGSDKYGYYNVANTGGYVSRYDVAAAIISEAGLKTKLEPVASEEFKSPALRPKNSRLDVSKLEKMGFEPLPDWKESLKTYLHTLNED